MPYVVDDIIKVEVYQTYLEKNMVNSLFYKILSIVSGAVVDAVLEALVEYIVDSFLPLQSEQVSHVGQTVYNLTDDISTLDVAYTVIGGGIGTEFQPSFVAMGWKKAVGTRLTRPGSLRIGGIQEDMSTGNTLNAAYQTIRDNFAAAIGLSKQVDDGSGNVVNFNPVVVGRLESPPDSGKYVYDLTRINILTGLVLPRITSQNSRKSLG